MSDERILARAREVLRIESAAVAALEDRIGADFLAAVRLILGLEGRLVVTGIGKSGVVARKLASTFSSTGTPALFLHPAEGMHGDIGVLVAGDALLAISKSGEAPELAQLFPAVRRLGLPIIALTASHGSRLAREADIVLDVGVRVEACPHEALSFGPRDEMVRVAWERVRSEPERYLPHVWGEHEWGGTSVLYVSDVDLGVLDFPDPATPPIPGLTDPMIEKTPFVGAGVAVGLWALGAIIARRNAVMASERCAVGKPAGKEEESDGRD